MADVEMTDAGPAAAPKSKSTAKLAKSGAADSGSDGKKKFEVKKVGEHDSLRIATSNPSVVECCGIVGLGYCGR